MYFNNFFILNKDRVSNLQWLTYNKILVKRKESREVLYGNKFASINSIWSRVVNAWTLQKLFAPAQELGGSFIWHALQINFLPLHGIYCNKLASFTVRVFQEKHCLWGRVAERLTPWSPDLEVRGSSHPLFPWTRSFTPLCLSSPRCTNGYRRHTAEG